MAANSFVSWSAILSLSGFQNPISTRKWWYLSFYAFQTNKGGQQAIKYLRALAKGHNSHALNKRKGWSLCSSVVKAAKCFQIDALQVWKAAFVCFEEACLLKVEWCMNAIGPMGKRTSFRVWIGNGQAMFRKSKQVIFMNVEYIGG